MQRKIGFLNSESAHPRPNHFQYTHPRTTHQFSGLSISCQRVKEKMNNSHLCTPLLSWTSHLCYTYDVSLGKSKHDKSQKCHTATLSSIDRETAHMLIRFLNNRLSPHTTQQLIFTNPSHVPNSFSHNWVRKRKNEQASGSDSRGVTNDCGFLRMEGSAWLKRNIRAGKTQCPASLILPTCWPKNDAYTYRVFEFRFCAHPHPTHSNILILR